MNMGDIMNMGGIMNMSEIMYEGDSLGIYNNNTSYDSTSYDSTSNESTLTNLDKDIQQGVAFMKYSKEFENAKDNQFSLLANTSGPNVGSIIEAYQDGRNSTQNNSQVTQGRMSPTEAQFNTLLSEYTRAYTTFNAALLKPRPSTNDLALQKAMEQQLLLRYQQLYSLANTLQNNSKPAHSFVVTNMNNGMHRRLSAKMVELNQQTKLLQHAAKRSEDTDVKGQLETTSLSTTSNHLHYLVFLITAITVIAFIVYLTVNPTADVTRVIYVMGILLVIYVVSRWII